MMNDGILQALQALYGASKREGERQLSEPSSSSYVDSCSGDECNMVDEDSDRTTVVPRGVAKRLDPVHFMYLGGGPEE